MTPVVQAPETDLLLPRPEEPVDPYTVHTYYFGFSVPEARIGAYVYARYQPAFGISQGGPTIFRGRDNLRLLDAAYHDYRITMPWPEIDGGSRKMANGLEIDVQVPGELIVLRYESPDGQTAFEVQQRGVTPLLARGHIVPGEEDHHDTAAGRRSTQEDGHEPAGSGTPTSPGGSEQFMHATGWLRLDGETHDVDCHAVRDRSWNQIRREDPGGAQESPPIGWAPAHFGEDLAFNVTCFEAQDTNPGWRGIYDVPDDKPTSYYAWMVRDGEPLELPVVRRNVTERDPRTHMPLAQELDVVDSRGAEHHFDGEMLAIAPMFSWPNIAFYDSLYRWTDSQGRVTHCTYQEIWWDRYQRAMNERVAGVLA